ncbi:BMP family lipoprotein [Mycoplasma elephantis]|uniref:BMP family lipoprotein n=1 Tax=Mycoplasma elephantis TaxID=114882 RepID=UPI000480478E|nr:BMP family ABC transporter substrate-binding protein [Mycoplasma elephantis]
MTKFKKTMLGLLGGVAGISVLATTSCGPKYTEEELAVQDKIGKVFFVTDGGSIFDKSFNQQGKEALDIITKGTGLNVVNLTNSPTEHSAIEVSKGYRVAEKKGTQYILAPGFNHVAAMSDYFKNNKNTKMKFILVDEINNPIDYDAKPKPAPFWSDEISKNNVAGITFNTNESAFFVGVYAAQYLVEIVKDETPNVSSWGGGNFPGVTDFITGFINGVKYYNEKLLPEYKKTNPKAKAVKFVLTGNNDKQFASGFAPEGGTDLAKTLIQNGADIIMPVAGSQTKNLVDALALEKDEVKNRIKIIGVDTDQKILFSEHSEFFLTSVEKNLKDAIVKVYIKIRKDDMKSSPDFKLSDSLEKIKLESNIKGVGETTIGNLSNGLVSFSSPSEKLAGGKYKEANDLYEKIKNDENIKKFATGEGNPVGAWTGQTKDEWFKKIEELNKQADEFNK